MKKRTQQQRIEILKKLLAVQCTDGTYNYDEYQFGFANGMKLALSVIQNTDNPEYLERPDIFKRDLELLDKLNKSSIIVHKDED